MLGFAWFYSSESGLFKGLRPIQIKIFPPSRLASQVVGKTSQADSHSFLLARRLAGASPMNRNIDSIDSAIRKEIAQKYFDAQRRRFRVNARAPAVRRMKSPPWPGRCGQGAERSTH